MDQAMIEDYAFGRLVLSGTTYTSDVLIFPDRVDDGWWRKEGHSLCMEDLRSALAEGPEVLIVGTGAHGVMDVPPEVRREISRKGIDLKIARTDQACEMYNRLAPRRKVVAALHLTC